RCKKSWVLAEGKEHQRVDVGGGLHKFDIVAGVEPSAGHIHRSGDWGKTALEKIILIVERLCENCRALISQMGWLSRKHRIDDIWAVALRLKIEENIGD